MRVISHYSRFLVIINVCKEDINHYKLLINHQDDPSPAAAKQAKFRP
ncbi:hypothetical protein [Alkalicoccus saliphilus]|nr:hypothetical protein [Alkalicoccus saliphilus]